MGLVRQMLFNSTLILFRFEQQLAPKSEKKSARKLATKAAPPSPEPSSLQTLKTTSSSIDATENLFSAENKFIFNSTIYVFFYLAKQSTAIMI